MVPAAIVGGYLGGRTARRQPQQFIRRLVIALAWGLTAWFFWRAWRTGG
jgi:uncharacterized membrane protein YfcA